MEETQNINYGEPEISWAVPEYEKHERSKNWYIGAVIVAIGLMIYAFLTSNFLFFGIILIAAFVFILNDKQEPAWVNVALTDEGVIIGKRFYDYDELKDFSVMYKPKQDLKNLYFEFKSAVKQRLSIPLLDQDPIAIRKHLLKYLQEDLERTDRPASESLAKMFKL